jgi:hypothetical protein
MTSLDRFEKSISNKPLLAIMSDPVVSRMINAATSKYP